MSDSELSSMASPTSTLDRSDVSDQASDAEIPRQRAATECHTSEQTARRPARSQKVPSKLRDAETELVPSVDLSSELHDKVYINIAWMVVKECMGMRKCSCNSQKNNRFNMYRACNH